VTEVIAERLNKLPTLTLHRGSHKPPNGAFAACAMEMVSWISGEPWSDRPECACPVLASFMRSWNDALPDAERTTLLLPFVPRLVGTRGSGALEGRRATIAADWLVRTHTPAWLRLTGLNAQAEALESFPEITDFSATPSILPALKAARDSASAAWAAAAAAAKAAAMDAARAKLNPTVEALQQSAIALLDRMIDEPEPTRI